MLQWVVRNVLCQVQKLGRQFSLFFLDWRRVHEPNSWRNTLAQINVIWESSLPHFMVTRSDTSFQFELDGEVALWREWVWFECMWQAERLMLEGPEMKYTQLMSHNVCAAALYRRNRRRQEGKMKWKEEVWWCGNIWQLKWYHWLCAVDISSVVRCDGRSNK